MRRWTTLPGSPVRKSGRWRSARSWSLPERKRWGGRDSSCPPGDGASRTLAVKMAQVQQAAEQVFREQSGRVLATLIRQVGDFELAEDALQDAFAMALATWSARGVPDNPAAWITTAARNKAIDRLRREASLAGKQATLQALTELRQHDREA